MNTKACVVLAACVVADSAVRADDWAQPSPRIFAAQMGHFAFKSVPLDPPFTKTRGILFRPSADAKEQVVWEQEFVNVPHRAFVAEDGKHVVTVDTYGHLGFEHALVLYGETGKTLADFRLEDLLSAREIRDKVSESASSRHWCDEATFKFDRTGHFTVTLKWGKVIKVELATGKLADSP